MIHAVQNVQPKGIYIVQAQHAQVPALAYIYKYNPCMYNTQTEHLSHFSFQFRPVLLYSTVIRFETVAMSSTMRANYSIHGRLTATVQLVSCDQSTWKPTVM